MSWVRETGRADGTNWAASPSGGSGKTMRLSCICALSSQDLPGSQKAAPCACCLTYTGRAQDIMPHDVGQCELSSSRAMSIRLLSQMYLVYENNLCRKKSSCMLLFVSIQVS